MGTLETKKTRKESVRKNYTDREIKLFDNEVIKPIVGYEEYYGVTSFGRVFNLLTKRELRQYQNNCGYYRVCLCLKYQSKFILIHQLVLQAFEDNINNYKEINHIDGCKWNNKIENLEYSTRSENMRHAFDSGIIVSKKGSQRYNHKLFENDVMYIKQSNEKIKDLAAKFKVSNTLICLIKKGHNWKHVEV